MPSAQLLLLMEQTLHHLYHRGVIGLGHVQSAVAASLGALGRIGDDGRDTGRHVTRRGNCSDHGSGLLRADGFLETSRRTGAGDGEIVDGTSLLNQTANLASSRRHWR